MFHRKIRHPEKIVEIQKYEFSKNAFPVPGVTVTAQLSHGVDVDNAVNSSMSVTHVQLSIIKHSFIVFLLVKNTNRFKILKMFVKNRIS